MDKEEMSDYEIAEYSEKIFKALDKTFDEVTLELLQITGTVPFYAILHALLKLISINVLYAAKNAKVPEHVALKVGDYFSDNIHRYIKEIYPKCPH